MRAWRIYDHTAPWARNPDHDPLDGDGGLYVAGRWHHAGTPVLYAAATPGLAVLEILTRIHPRHFRERTIVCLDLLEAGLETVTDAHLLQLQRDAPADDPLATTRDHGSLWLREARSLVLEVPSIVLPLERNYLINPLHPDMKRVRVVLEQVITLDPRLRS